jgi:hypothetical protein
MAAFAGASMGASITAVFVEVFTAADFTEALMAAEAGTASRTEIVLRLIGRDA